MVRILHAPRWAFAVVMGTLVVAVALLVTGLSASANAAPSNAAAPQRAAAPGDYVLHSSDNQTGDNQTETKTITNTTTNTKTVTNTATTTATKTTTTTATAPTATITQLPVTGSSSRSPLILIGSGLLLAGGLGMLGLRRWRDAADRRG
jgi:LPXTG-motif cell wall-anchored protein